MGGSKGERKREKERGRRRWSRPNVIDWVVRLKSLRANGYLRYGRELHTVPPPPRDKLDCQLDRYKAASGTTLGRSTTMYGDSSAACVDASSCGVITQLMRRETLGASEKARGVRKRAPKASKAGSETHMTTTGRFAKSQSAPKRHYCATHKH